MALATVSDGPYAGTQVMTSLVFTLWKMGAWVVPAMYRVLDELLWCMQANEKMQPSK